MDAIDRKILTLLQKDASISLAVLAAHINLTTTPCWKRVQRLERDGYITKRVALVSPEKLNLKQTVLATVSAAGLAPEQVKKFISDVSAMPNVVEFYRIDSKDEFSLRLVIADRDAYDAFHKRLTEDLHVKEVSVNFVTQQLKSTTAFPVPATLGRK